MENKREAFFIEMYIAHFEKVSRYAYGITGMNEVAQDLVHQAFSVLLHRIDYVMEHPNPAGWLYKTIKNLCLKELAKNQKKDYYEISIEELQDTLYSSHTYKNANSLLEILPSGLSAEERQLLIWRYEENLSSKEIAEQLGITEAACRQKIYRAQQHCSDIFR